MMIGGLEVCPKCRSPVSHVGYPTCHFFSCRNSACQFFMKLPPELTRDEAIAEYNRRLTA